MATLGWQESGVLHTQESVLAESQEKVRSLLAQADRILQKAMEVAPHDVEVERQKIRDEMTSLEKLKEQLSRHQATRDQAASLREEVTASQAKVGSLNQIVTELGSYRHDLTLERDDLMARLTYALEEAEACRSRLPLIEAEVEDVDTETQKTQTELASATEELHHKEALVHEIEQNVLLILKGGGQELEDEIPDSPKKEDGPNTEASVSPPSPVQPLDDGRGRCVG